VNGQTGPPGASAESELEERLRRAFSVRENLRALFRPPGPSADGDRPPTDPPRLRALDGVRALSVLWVVLFHAAWYAAWYVPPARYGAMLFSPAMLLVWRGDFGVDVFFVLSGFLIAGMLVDERAQTGDVRLGLFYLRRLMRLWPALAVAVLADVLVIGDHVDMTWANLLYVSNLVPVTEGAMGWTWSLAIEEQFYLACPWLVRAIAPLRAGARAPLLAALPLVMCAVGACVVHAGAFRAPDGEIVVNRDPARWALAFDALYSKPWMRAGPLLVGVGAAYLYRVPGAVAALGRARAWGAAGLLAAVALAAASTHWQIVEHAPRGLEIAYLAGFRTAFGVAVAYIILLALSPHPLGRLLGRALSWRPLYPFAQLAYSAYLLNPIVTIEVEQHLSPLVGRTGASPLLLFLPFTAIGTFVAAAAMHVLVERPFMRLRPR
jgi:peptidoglycan/LPS O-acetylase OafA/YrhL